MDMLKARKEELKKRGVSGFTLMEMLIVIAIIAILIAIAIPVMSDQLNRARVSSDAANIRSGYASVFNEVTKNDSAQAAGSWYLYSDGSVSQTSTGSGNGGGTIYTTQGTSTEGLTVGGVAVNSGRGWDSGKNVVYTVDTKGAITAISVG